MLGVQTVGGEHLLGGAGAAELVVHTVTHHGYGAGSGQELADCAAQAADNIGFLGGDDGTGLLSGLQQQLFVQRLNGVEARAEMPSAASRSVA